MNSTKPSMRIRGFTKELLKFGGVGHEQHFIAVEVYADLLLVAKQKERARAIALEALEIGRTNSTVPRDLVEELETQLGF